MTPRAVLVARLSAMSAEELLELLADVHALRRRAAGGVTVAVARRPSRARRLPPPPSSSALVACTTCQAGEPCVKHDNLMADLRDE